jgi:hypothetical protein
MGERYTTFYLAMIIMTAMIIIIATIAGVGSLAP